MTDKLIKELIKRATFVSGMAGLANVDLSKSGTELPEEKWPNSINVIETNKGLKISIGIIVDYDVRAKIVSYEVSSSIKALMAKNNEKLDKVNVYVRGVK